MKKPYSDKQKYLFESEHIFKALSKKNKHNIGSMIVYLQARNLSKTQIEDVAHDFLRIISDAESRNDRFADDTNKLKVICDDIIASVKPIPRKQVVLSYSVQYLSYLRNALLYVIFHNGIYHLYKNREFSAILEVTCKDLYVITVLPICFLVGFRWIALTYLDKGHRFGKLSRGEKIVLYCLLFIGLFLYSFSRHLFAFSIYYWYPIALVLSLIVLEIILNRKR